MYIKRAKFNDGDRDQKIKTAKSFSSGNSFLDLAIVWRNTIGRDFRAKIGQKLSDGGSAYCG
jgi:hypothetical protein